MAPIPVNIAEYVGGTPIVQITRLLGPDAAEGVELYAKIESFNPGGSVKDRIGIAMIEAAERDGLIEPGAPPSSRPPPATPGSRSRSCARPRATTSCSPSRRA